MTSENGTSSSTTIGNEIQKDPDVPLTVTKSSKTIQNENERDPGADSKNGNDTKNILASPSKGKSEEGQSKKSPVDEDFSKNGTNSGEVIENENKKDPDVPMTETSSSKRIKNENVEDPVADSKNGNDTNYIAESSPKRKPEEGQSKKSPVDEDFSKSGTDSGKVIENEIKKDPDVPMTETISSNRIKNENVQDPAADSENGNDTNYIAESSPKRKPEEGQSKKSPLDEDFSKMGTNSGTAIENEIKKDPDVPSKYKQASPSKRKSEERQSKKSRVEEDFPKSGTNSGTVIEREIKKDPTETSTSKRIKNENVEGPGADSKNGNASKYKQASPSKRKSEEGQSKKVDKDFPKSGTIEREIKKDPDVPMTETSSSKRIKIENIEDPVADSKNGNASKNKQTSPSKRNSKEGQRIKSRVDDYFRKSGTSSMTTNENENKKVAGVDNKNGNASKDNAASPSKRKSKTGQSKSIFRLQEYYSILNQDSRKDREEHFHFFFGIKSPFSNLYPASFKIEGRPYSCVEQYMMHRKAVLFKDKKHGDEIMRTDDPKMMKKLGRKVENFDKGVWNANCKAIVKTALRGKFSQNGDLKKQLFDTFPKILVEAAPRDRLWGIGLGGKNPKAHCRRTWRGANKLGYLMSDVRNELMKHEDMFK